MLNIVMDANLFYIQFNRYLLKLIDTEINPITTLYSLLYPTFCARGCLGELLIDYNSSVVPVDSYQFSIIENILDAEDIICRHYGSPILYYRSIADIDNNIRFDLQNICEIHKNLNCARQLMGKEKLDPAMIVNARKLSRRVSLALRW